MHIETKQTSLLALHYVFYFNSAFNQVLTTILFVEFPLTLLLREIRSRRQNSCLFSIIRPFNFHFPQCETRHDKVDVIIFVISSPIVCSLDIVKRFLRFKKLVSNVSSKNRQRTEPFRNDRMFYSLEGRLNVQKYTRIMDIKWGIKISF